MRCLRVASVTLVVLGWGLGGVAQAGDVTRTPTAVTYQAVVPALAEDVTLALEPGSLFVSSVRGAATTDCTQTDPTRADCAPAPTAVVNLLDTADVVRAATLPAGIAVIAHGGGGYDTIGGAPGADRLFGDDGNDKLDGGAGGDLLDGGTGEDTITGGPGQDQIVGGIGDDVIDSRDGEVDVVDCGAGTDSALIDPGDTTAGCEAAQLPDGSLAPPAPAPPGTTGPLPAIVSFTASSKRIRVSRSGRFTYTFRATPGAAGSASLQSRRSVSVGSHKRRLNVGARSFTTPAAGTVRLAFKLSAASLRALRRASPLAFTVSVALGSTTFTGKLTLLAPKRQKR